MNFDARDVLLIASNVDTMDVSKNMKKQYQFDDSKDYEKTLFVLDTDF